MVSPLAGGLLYSLLTVIVSEAWRATAAEPKIANDDSSTHGVVSKILEGVRRGHVPPLAGRPAG